MGQSTRRSRVKVNFKPLRRGRRRKRRRGGVWGGWGRYRTGGDHHEASSGTQIDFDTLILMIIRSYSWQGGCYEQRRICQVTITVSSEGVTLLPLFHPAAFLTVTSSSSSTLPFPPPRPCFMRSDFPPSFCWFRLFFFLLADDAVARPRFQFIPPNKKLLQLESGLLNVYFRARKI